MLVLALALTIAVMAPQDPGDASWPAERARRAQWWSWQPVVRHETPPLPAGAVWDAWRDEAIDGFVGARLAAAGLEPAPAADRATLLRRVYLVLTGLPPTPEAVAAFGADARPDAYVRRVDDLLASRGFGERFARHWMDWVRYAETHGSEGDPAVPHAWRYRDYLIRALERDVPYDQLVREHLAGDLLVAPRIDAAGGAVESILGTVPLRMVQHGYSPVDAFEEKVRFVDDQIDVVSKAFLGMTVSCARCHDHKFDAISQADYHALFGVFASMRPAMLTIDRPDDLRAMDAELDASRAALRTGLARAWQGAARDGTLAARLEGIAPAVLSRAAGEPSHVLHTLARAAADGDVARTVADLEREFAASRARLGARPAPLPLSSWLLAGSAWTDAAGRPRADAVAPPGEIHLPPDGERIVAAVLPAGMWSQLRSSRHAAIAATPTVTFDAARIALRLVGDGGARARYVIEGYPRQGTVYPLHVARGGGPAGFVTWDVDYWRGARGHVEVSTAADQPVEVDTGAERSWFGVSELYFLGLDDAVPRDESAEWSTPLFEVLASTASAAPTTLAALRARYAAAAERSAAALEAGRIDDPGARFLDGLLRAGVLPSTFAELPDLAGPAARHRELERRVPVARRAPGVRDAEPIDQPLMVRGDHRNLGAPVPRRFLETIDAAPYAADRPARLQLADDLVAPGNPLAPRVAVNRFWHHVFGRGLAATPDNLGALGEPPTHPELLDRLAADFVASGWSIRALVRRMVLSQTFQQRADVDPARFAADPANRLWSRHAIRRLDAEAIRDALLAVSGRLVDAPFGPSVEGHEPRRSIYVRVRRNDLDPFLATFDAPAPHTARGRRDVTDVPAQALTLANDPFVIDTARAFAAAVQRELGADATPAAIARRLFERAHARPAHPEEIDAAVAFARRFEAVVAELRAERDALVARCDAVAGELDAIRAPVRARLEAARAAAGGGSPPGPEPLAAWDFTTEDAARSGTLHGSARIVDGALVLDGDGSFRSAPLATALGAKTLAATLLLDDLGQRGGGVIAVQSADGARFDGIVFGERDPGQWLAGSDFFRRTASFDGPVETDAVARAVHVAIAWDADGTIRAWRDGAPYGRAYRAGGVLGFGPGEAVVLLGLRHSPPAAGKQLRGRILAAELHARALTDDEVRQLARAAPRAVTDAEADAALSPAERARVAALEAQLAALRAAVEPLAAQLAAAGALPGPGPDAAASADAWRAVAQSLFASKEFLFLR